MAANSPDSKDSTQTLLLVRHAHRDKPRGGAFDNGLSAKGLKQARALRRWYKKEFGRGPVLLISSPKLRCVETLEPLAEWLETTIRVEEFLNEGDSLEAKAHQLERFWHHQKCARVIACSHGDVIPVALHHLTGARAELDKGAVAEIEATPHGISLRALIQAP